MTGGRPVRCPVCRRVLTGDVWAVIRRRPYARLDACGRVVQRGDEDIVVAYCDEHVPTLVG